MLKQLLASCLLSLTCGIAQAEPKPVKRLSAIPQIESPVDESRTVPAQALIPREQEIELALKAAPVHLRKDATVYVFSKTGYEKARTGTNGFNCLVNRDGTQNGDLSVYPTCWDPEGSRTILPVMLRVGKLIAQQKSAAEIKRDIDEGFSQGKLQGPTKAGIAYMLAGDVKFDLKSGQVSSTEFPPHYMIYAPGLTNADIGMSEKATTPGLPFVYSGYSGGTKTAYIIVMANQSAGHTMQGQNRLR
ncbi:MAG: hypothetical protein ACMG6H_13235 [Acidobacteriota bacterium]